MSLYKRGEIWWYKFEFAGRMIRESAKTGSKTVARDAEKKRRRELEEGYNNLTDRRDERVRSFRHRAAEFLEEYRLRNPRSAVFAAYAIRHLNEHFADSMMVDISEHAVQRYQTSRLKEKASPKTINEEVGFLLRVLGEQGDALRVKMKRNKSLKLTVRNNIGKPFSCEQKEALLAASVPGARAEKASLIGKPVKVGGETETPHKALGGTRSPYIGPALVLALNTGMRNREIRELKWSNIDFDKRILTVGKSKTAAGEGRTIPMLETVFTALVDHAKWYTAKFGTTNSDWYIFPGRAGKPTSGEKRPYDPTKPVTSLKTAWRNIKQKAGVKGRFHDTRHTLITELSESGAGDQTIMEIAGHVSPQMLRRYSHTRMEAKRNALEAIQPKVQLDTKVANSDNVQQTEAVQPPPIQ